MARTASPAGKSKKSGAKNTARKKTAAAGKKAPTGRPIRREVGGFVCLFLGIFSFIGYFNVDALFIDFFCGFVKALTGWGYYLFPPALLYCAYILLFHRGRSVVLRVVSTLLLPLILGAFIHILFCKLEVDFTGQWAKLLYDGGKGMVCGGFLGGLAGIGLESTFSVYGAVPVLLFLFFLLLMLATNLSVSKIATYFKSRPRVRYEPEPEPDVAFEAVPEQELLPPAEPGQARRRTIDIPLDGEPRPAADYAEEKVGFFNRRPRVRTPDQVLAEPKPDPASVTKDPVAIKTFQAAGPTDNVQPLPLKEAEDLAGVVTTTVREISEPPRRRPAQPGSGGTAAEREQIAREAAAGRQEEYVYPPVDMLKMGFSNTSDGREEIALNRDRLDSTLRSFGVSAAIVNITRGPTVTRYDLELEQGVKLNKLTNLAGDLALSLGVVSVRIAPIPDKISTVGVEVPNKIVSTVYLRDIVDSPAFKSAQSRLSFALGKDIGGNAIVGNISKLPHMLIAGTTGSGKSVCMNSLIVSLLYKAKPEEVRLIMIDPKMVELGIYNGIPHLFVPVVTDPKKASGALQWAVVEMLKRYRLFSEAGVRDLSGYNNLQKNTEGGEPLPQVVIVIDELADLMLVASKEVEESICRVAQMGRASGMHLVIATQRPSADVITGLMKANIPSRIAFAVSSAMESRIILDSQGAEKLVGMGDMLYSPLGSGKPTRIQGAFISDEERENVISFIKEKSEAQYSEDIIAQIEKAAEEKGGKDSGAPLTASDLSETGDIQEDNPFAGYDELLPQAVDVIFETKQASVSMLQRRLKLGYSRAARLVDQMEEIGVVGPFEGSKPRQIMITLDQWREMQLTAGTAPIGKHADSPDFAGYEDEAPEDWDEV